MWRSQNGGAGEDDKTTSKEGAGADEGAHGRRGAVEMVSEGRSVWEKREVSVGWVPKSIRKAYAQDGRMWVSWKVMPRKRELTGRGGGDKRVRAVDERAGMMAYCCAGRNNIEATGQGR